MPSELELDALYFEAVTSVDSPSLDRSRTRTAEAGGAWDARK